MKPLGENSGNAVMRAQPQFQSSEAPRAGTEIPKHSKTANPNVKTKDPSTGDIASGKRTRSSRYLKSLLERDKTRSKDPDGGRGKTHLRSKSSTTTYSVFPRPTSSRSTVGRESEADGDKENEPPAQTPIWAQFATARLDETSGMTKIPLNDDTSLKNGNPKYTHRQYSPSKQMGFAPDQQPTLSRRPQQKNRPKSECLGDSSSQGSFLDTISNLRRSKDSGTLDGNNAVPRESPMNSEGKPVAMSSELRNESEVNVVKRTSRVMAAVAALNGRAKQATQEAGEYSNGQAVDPKAIESAFESMLDARNVPQNTREKMRALDTSIKADLVKQDRTSSTSASSIEEVARKPWRPGVGTRSKTETEVSDQSDGRKSLSHEEEPAKRARPRSRTFTFSKGEGSPTKKQKSERQRSRSRPRPGDLTHSSSTRSLAGETPKAWALGKSQVFTTLDDCISYLRKRQPPQEVEVGKLHKLKQLLRNETVELVNSFISNGGMTEIIDLLYRIFLVEWREEHEDTLLHEALSCLKALSTTSLALQKLTSTHARLFPALLGSLFSEEKKGPSDFTTRTIIVGLFSTYLSSAPTPDVANRARTLLSYLEDPSKPEASQPLGFIASMHVPRPYRVWQKEISDVTKEVFWIFLHNTNIIPFPESQPGQDGSTYTTRHHPKPHTPIPTAPYIGGVEWEATTYLTAHVDLLNGIIAALPTMYERNALRQKLKDSGFEKIMGSSLRTCKEKFYGSVHEALSTWVGAASEDDWDVKGVREGALPKTAPNSPKKSVSPKKENKSAAPKLDMPKLDMGECIGKRKAEGFEGWF